MRARPLLILSLITACKQPTPPPMVVVQDAAPAFPDPEEALPLDPQVRHGQLPNGLRYFLRATEPSDHAVFRLAVDAGSLLEEDDQRGVAHVVEHIAYAEAPDALSSGPHIDSHTSFDATVYGLRAPADEAPFETPLGVLHQWACCLRFEPATVDAALAVARAEWRSEQGPSQRYWERMAPAIYRGAPHAERMPIGTEASLGQVEPAALRRFYETWYRPEHLTLVVTGGVDVDAVEARIRSVFADLENGEPLERPRFPLDLAHDRAYVLATDPEAHAASMTWVAKQAHPQPTTFGALRASLERRLAVTVLQERLAERGLAGDAAFLHASVEPQRWNAQQAGVGLQVGFDEGQLLPALRQVWTEVRRLELHGVNPGELERARASLRRRRPGTDADTLADRLVQHALAEEPVVGRAFAAEHEHRLLAQITVEQVDRHLPTLLRSQAEVFGATVPARGPLPTVEQIEAVFSEVDASEPAPLPDAVVPRRLVETPPTPQPVEMVDRRFEELGFTGYRFANGIEVWARPTDFAPDEVRMVGWIDGGLAGVPEDEALQARAAVALLRWSGLGDHQADSVRRFFADKQASLAVQLDGDRLRMSGTASSGELELQLQKLWSTMQHARLTEEGLQHLKASWVARQRSRSTRASARFDDAWHALTAAQEPWLAAPSPADIEALELAEIERSWNEVLQGLGRAKLVFVGDLPPGFEALLTRWIGSLPGPRDGLPSTQLRARLAGPLEDVVRVGAAQRALLRVEVQQELVPDGPIQRARYDATAEILTAVLQDRVADGFEGVSVSVRSSSGSPPAYRFRIEGACAAEQLDQLEQTIEATLHEVAEAGVPPGYVQAQLAKDREAHRMRLQMNGFWTAQLADALQRGEDPRWVRTFGAQEGWLTPAIVQEIVASAFDPERRATLKMLPEG